jgi:hypothetical protein
MSRKPRALRKGDRVVCDRGTPPSGAWRQFAGRTGVVTVADNLGEVGITLDDTGLSIWLLPTDLRHIEETA